MIIHSYATDGFLSFAKTLILSLKKQHGESIPFILHTKDLKPEQIEQLYDLYRNLTVKNSETDWKWLEKQTHMKYVDLLTGKNQVEQMGNRYMSTAFSHWKHYISIYSRYRDAIAEVMDSMEDGDTLLHLDADLYINKNIDTIFNLIKLADVSLLLRPNYNPEWRKVYGCILGFTINDQSRKFMDRVRYHINTPKFTDIPKGYGQIVFWRAYTELKDRKQHNIRFADIPKTWIHKGFNNRSFILSANNGLRKKETAIKYNKLIEDIPITPDPPKKSNLKKPKPIRRKQSVAAKRTTKLRVGRKR